MAVIFAAAVAAAPPSPSPSAQPGDTCAAAGHTALLNALNRPTVGYSPCAVKPGDVVAELGYAKQSGDVEQVQEPQGFTRYGMAENLEVDLVAPSGHADSGAGLKWEFAHNANSAAAIDFIYTVPSGAAAFTAGVPTQLLNVDYGRSLGAFGVGVTMGAFHGSYYAAFPSAVVTALINPRAQLYAEAFAQSRTRPLGGALGGLDGGIQYLLSPAIEVDAEAGRTITDTARVHYVGFGAGLRL
jgi:hypothetical protein